MHTDLYSAKFVPLGYHVPKPSTGTTIPPLWPLLHGVRAEQSRSRISYRKVKIMFNDHSHSNISEITDAELRTTAPAVFAEAPMPGASHRYTFLPTGQLVAAMRQEGWKPVEARQMGVRSIARLGFQRHMVRFQRRDVVAEVNDFAPEVILLNSHDRSSEAASN
jgi:hypothetical protein